VGTLEEVLDNHTAGVPQWYARLFQVASPESHGEARQGEAMHTWRSTPQAFDRNVIEEKRSAAEG
jgi:hypothetical protein